MIPTKVFHSIFVATLLLSSGISAQQWGKLDTSRIVFTTTMMDSTREYVSFDSKGNIKHFPKDSLTAIKVMYNAMMQSFENRKSQDKYINLYFYAAEILKYINKDGVVTDKNKFKKAVDQFIKEQNQY